METEMALLSRLVVLIAVLSTNQAILRRRERAPNDPPQPSGSPTCAVNNGDRFEAGSLSCDTYSVSNQNCLRCCGPGRKDKCNTICRSFSQVVQGSGVVRIGNSVFYNGVHNFGGNVVSKRSDGNGGFSDITLIRGLNVRPVGHTYFNGRSIGSSGGVGRAVVGRSVVFSNGGDFNKCNGFENIIRKGSNNIINAGSYNLIEDSTKAEIGAGSNNRITKAKDSTIGAGSNNVIQKGRANIISSGSSNKIVNGEANSIGSGSGNQMQGGKQNSISAGSSNRMVGGNDNTISAGSGNEIMNGQHNTITAGSANSIENSSGVVISAASAKSISGKKMSDGRNSRGKSRGARRGNQLHKMGHPVFNTSAKSKCTVSDGGLFTVSNKDQNLRCDAYRVDALQCVRCCSTACDKPEKICNRICS